MPNDNTTYGYFKNKTTTYTFTELNNGDACNGAYYVGAGNNGIRWSSYQCKTIYTVGHPSYNAGNSSTSGWIYTSGTGTSYGQIKYYHRFVDLAPACK
jgi:hypothetical protein